MIIRLPYRSCTFWFTPTSRKWTSKRSLVLRTSPLLTQASKINTRYSCNLWIPKNRKARNLANKCSISRKFLSRSNRLGTRLILFSSQRSKMTRLRMSLMRTLLKNVKIMSYCNIGHMRKSRAWNQSYL